MTHPSPNSSSPVRCLAWCVTIGIGALVLALPSVVSGQDEERPEVHSEFTFGSFPYSAEATVLFESEDARRIIGAFDRGWSIDKFVEETGSDEIEVLTLVDALEQENLVRGINDFDMRPGLLLVREAEAREMSAHVQADAVEFVRIIEENWDDVEQFVASLEAGAQVSRGQLLYTAIVGGLLTGGVVDALLDDQTLIPGPPRRARRGEGYYAWMTEGTAPRPLVKRESARVGRYTVVSLGTAPEENPRIQIEDLRGQGPVFESQDAGRLRVFSSVFSRDNLFPYFKSRRGALLELHPQLRSARYTAFGEFAAWYYQMLVTQVTVALSESGRITPPESTYQYAVRTGR